MKGVVGMGTIRFRRMRSWRGLLIAGIGLASWFGVVPATADQPSLPEVKGVQVDKAEEEALFLPGTEIPPHDFGYLAPAAILLAGSAGLRALSRRAGA
jgi:hypothetical protein